MACCAVAAVASAACGGGASSGGTRGGADGGSTTVRVLQLNLCDSGIARCYTGRSVAAATGAIRAERPEIVTLNEVCRGDVSVLRRALSRDDRDGVLVSAFEAAVQPLAGHRPVRCRNGQQYGV